MNRVLAVVHELARSVVAVPDHEQPVWPAHRDIEAVENMQWLAVRPGISPDRLRLERELLGAQCLAHALQRGARLRADLELLLAGGFRRVQHGRGQPHRSSA